MWDSGKTHALHVCVPVFNLQQNGMPLALTGVGLANPLPSTTMHV